MLRPSTSNKNIFHQHPRVITATSGLKAEHNKDKGTLHANNWYFVMALAIAMAMVPFIAKAQNSVASSASASSSDTTSPSSSASTSTLISDASLEGKPVADGNQQRRDQLQRMSHHMLFFGEGANPQSQDSIDRMIELFYVDQYRAFQDPMAPYFLFMSKDTRLAMGVGGAVRMRAWADFAGEIPENGFSPYNIPVPANPLLRKRIGGTPGGTSLFLKVIGRNIMGYTVMAYIQGGFDEGTKYAFRLKKAYFSINDWMVGYNTTTFSDNEAQAPFIDGAGSNGDASTTTMLVRWSHTSPKNHLTYALSLEIPKTFYHTDNMTVAHLDSWVPDVAGFIQGDFARNQHIRLAGILSTISYRNLVTKKNRNVLGWGAQLSTILRPHPDLNIFATANYGRGIACRNGDLKIGAYDLVPSHIAGEMEAPKFGSISFGAQYFFTEHVFASASAGQVRYFALDNTPQSDYKYGRYVNATLFYEPTARLQVGVEFVGGQRFNINGEHAAAHRAAMLFQFSF